MSSVRRLALTLPLVALVAACSDSVDGPTESTDPGVAPDVCAPLHRKLDEPNEDQYVFYPTDQAAVDALTEFLPKAGLKAPLAPGHPTQATAEAVLKDVYPAFQKVYDTETVGLDAPPRVAILDDPSPNAFALNAVSTDPKQAKAPWVLVFQTGAFEAAVNQDDLRGLVGHELAHLVLRNRKESVSKSYQRRYLAPLNESNTYGAYVNDDPKVAARIATIEGLHSVVGRVGVPELSGLPLYLLQSTTEPSPQYMLIFEKAYEKYKPTSGDQASCTEFEQRLTAIAKIFSGPIEPNDYSATVSADDKTKIKIASDGAKAAALRCVGGVERSIADAVEDLFGTRPTTLDPTETAAETKFAGKDLFAEIIELSATRQKELYDLENATDLPLTRLRFYRGEEDADVASVRVMRALGRESRAVGQFLLRTTSDAYAADCMAKVKAGTVPVYGFVRDDHPATCWRYWNVDRLATKLDACPK